MGKAQRTKGQAFERFIANELKPIDSTARRNVSESQEGSYDILTELPIALQCKCFSKWHVSPHSIWQQAKDHAGTRIPVGVVRIDRKKPDLAIISWDDFKELIRIYYGKTE